jgi:hypothetical protein
METDGLCGEGIGLARILRLISLKTPFEIRFLIEWGTGDV